MEVKLRGFSPSNLVSPHKIARMRKSFKNFRLTLVCGFMTFLILRGMIGGGKFGTAGRDIHEISQRIDAFHSKESDRAAQVKDPMTNSRDVVIHGEPVATAKPYSLGPKISDWDAQRAKVMTRSGDNHKGRMLLVTGSQPNPCDNPVGDHYLLKSIKNKIDYCRLHSIEIFYNTAERLDSFDSNQDSPDPSLYISAAEYFQRLDSFDTDPDSRDTCIIKSSKCVNQECSCQTEMDTLESKNTSIIYV